MGGALHIRRRYRALFLAVRNFHISNAIQNKCRGNSTGCIIYSSVVCCEGTSYLQRTLYGCLYTSTWVFLCLFIASVVEDREQKQADASTHVFYFVVDQVITNPFAQGVCGLLLHRKRT